MVICLTLNSKFLFPISIAKKKSLKGTSQIYFDGLKLRDMDKIEAVVSFHGAALPSEN